MLTNSNNLSAESHYRIAVCLLTPSFLQFKSLVLIQRYTSLTGHLRKIAKSDYRFRHDCPSVRPHGTTRLPLEGIPRNLILECFSNIFRENSSFFKNPTRITGTLREDLSINLWYIAQFSLEWEMFQPKIVQKIKTHNVQWLFPDNRAFMK